jgi:hypothetical protein
LQAAVSRKSAEYGSQAGEDKRCALAGSSFSVPVVAWLMSHKLYHAGVLAAPPSVELAWGLEQGVSLRDFAEKLGYVDHTDEELLSR